jgi:hypothetical protein
MRVLLAVMLLTVGCRTRPFELDDGGAGDGGARDMTMVDFAVRCRTHAREFVKLTSLTRVDANEALGRTLRVRADIPLRQGCDVLADVEATIQPGNATDFVVITARAWRGDVSCGPEQTVSRIIDMDDMPFTNLRITVSDGAPGGTARLEISPKAQTGACGGPQPAMCTLDCHCAAGLVCLSQSATSNRCVTSCNNDADCPPNLPFCGGDSSTPKNVCMGTDLIPGCDCTLGQSCAGGRCQPATNAAPEKPCMCGADCATSQICARMLETSGDPNAPICITPCTTNSDCPRGMEACVRGRCRPLV